MREGIRRASGEDAARPTVGPADFDELMGEHPGVAAGKGISFGYRRGARFDGPSFELRGEIRSVELCDRQTRRIGAPSNGFETVREIFPRAERRPPFPDTKPALARPPHAPGQPERTEVMEEREEQGTRAGGPEDRRTESMNSLEA